MLSTYVTVSTGHLDRYAAPASSSKNVQAVVESLMGDRYINARFSHH